MGNKRSNAVVFKPYLHNQTILFPGTLDEMIPENHPARLVSKVIDTIDIRAIHRKYKGGGTSAYHPRLLLKILVYGYLTNTYSSRKLEEQARQNIYFMWLTGMVTPDHHTINRFRGDKLNGLLKEIFSQIVFMLANEGMVSLKEAVFVDGTKIESAANRYTFVWGKAIQKNKDRIKAQLDELWKYAQGIATEELKDQREVTFETVTKEKVEEVIKRIDTALEGKDVPKQIRNKIRHGKKNWPANLDRYEDQEKKLNGRNSYSKTDVDATFMRMKEDHMRNGQLKPAYNLQLSTQDQFILNYSLHQNPTDTLTLKPHLNQFKDLYNQYPAAAVADAGYGSSENYNFLEQNNIEAYVKFAFFDKSQKASRKATPAFLADAFDYNETSGELICPTGKVMTHSYDTIERTSTGYKRTISTFKASSCSTCPMKEMCVKPGHENREVAIDLDFRRYKKKATALLVSERGVRYRKKRPIDVEPVFGNIKNNHGFKRFKLRTKNKAEIEIGLLCIAQNLRKWQA
jgi:transposase